MSVLIKGMDMPDSCRECALGQYTKSGIRCIVLSKRDGFSHSTGFGNTARMSGCPLVEVPSVQPERKGNWVGIGDESCETFECDRCGFVLEDWIQGAFYNFCPNCGADMRGEQNEVHNRI